MTHAKAKVEHSDKTVNPSNPSSSVLIEICWARGGRWQKMTRRLSPLENQLHRMISPTGIRRNTLTSGSYDTLTMKYRGHCALTRARRTRYTIRLKPAKPVEPAKPVCREPDLSRARLGLSYPVEKRGSHAYLTGLHQKTMNHYAS